MNWMDTPLPWVVVFVFGAIFGAAWVNLLAIITADIRAWRKARK